MTWEAVSIMLQRFCKRLLDFSVSLFVAIFLFPFILVIAVAIRLDSPGPIVYRHQRVGRDGIPFGLLKFRSMVSGGDDGEYMLYLKQLIESERGTQVTGNGKAYRKMESDPRITRIGGFLRKYYLDELPQLWNVLWGEMSLVGTRPHVQFEVDYYTSDQCRRLSVPPGLTGLWQVIGKADCSFNELIALDLNYIDNWGFWTDTQIIFQTFLLMARGGESFWTRKKKEIHQNESQTMKIEPTYTLSQEEAIDLFSQKIEQN